MKIFKDESPSFSFTPLPSTFTNINHAAEDDQQLPNGKHEHYFHFVNHLRRYQRLHLPQGFHKHMIWYEACLESCFNWLPTILGSGPMMSFCQLHGKTLHWYIKVRLWMAKGRLLSVESRRLWPSNIAMSWEVDEERGAIHLHRPRYYLGWSHTSYQDP